MSALLCTDTDDVILERRTLDKSWTLLPRT